MITNPGKAVNPQAVFQLPWAQVIARTVSTPAIGACKEALRLYQQAALNKQSSDPTKLADDTTTQERITAAGNGIDEMEAVLFNNFNKMMACVDSGEQIPTNDRIH